jgi:hypothetical protein
MYPIRPATCLRPIGTKNDDSSEPNLAKFGTRLPRAGVRVPGAAQASRRYALAGILPPKVFDPRHFRPLILA